MRRCASKQWTVSPNVADSLHLLDWKIKAEVFAITLVVNTDKQTCHAMHELTHRVQEKALWDPGKLADWRYCKICNLTKQINTQYKKQARETTDQELCSRHHRIRQSRRRDTDGFAPLFPVSTLARSCFGPFLLRPVPSLARFDF